MENSTLIIILAVVIVAAAVGIWFVLQQKRRSESLRHKFGPEYDRAVQEHGGPRQAEAALAAREKRVETFHVVPLAAGARDRFVASWKAAQARFVDSPKDAVREADRLVAEVMKERGYPIGAFEQRAADVSVDHPKVVDNYRRAHAIAVRNDKEGVTTEDLRTAMVHYRTLFEDLLETPAHAHVEVVK
jgi:hypothetical protein